MTYDRNSLINQVNNLPFVEKQNLISFLGIYDDFHNICIEKPREVCLNFPNAKPFMTSAKYACWYDLQNVDNQHEYYTALECNKKSSIALIDYCEKNNLIGQLIIAVNN